MRRLAPLLALWLIAAAPAPVALLAHRALYRLSLVDGRGNVVAGSGLMGFQLTAACPGWRLTQRLEMTVTDAEGAETHMISAYRTWESADGTRLRFHTTQTTDGRIAAETAGTARLLRPGGPGAVDYMLPGGPHQVALPAGTLFPLAQTRALIAAALAGKRFLSAPLFDGTGAHGATPSSMVALARLPPGPAPFPLLASLPSVRLQLAFFSHDPRAVGPDFQTTVRYWANGVAGTQLMDFGDFVIKARLIALHPLAQRCGR
ncbi:MAG: EipB family protein [Acetobacteraceae bacterium]